MKKNKNRNRSNKRNKEATAQNTLPGEVGEILDSYSDNECIRTLETIIVQEANERGECDGLHMCYYASLAAYAAATTNTCQMLHIARTENHVSDYFSAYATDLIAEVIYLSKKDSLGLINKTISKEDFSFEVAAEGCGLPADYEAMNAIMLRVENEVSASLNELTLDRTEVIATPYGIVCSTFAFHKILDQVFRCMKNEDYHEVRFITESLIYVACYEVASHVYRKYTESMKKSA